MESQGYKIEDNILFQDNQSTIKMETNGRRSCIGNSRHVNIRYFFVKDLVDKKQVKIIYCPTGIMLADFFTKHLQGELYRFFRDIIMGYKSTTDIICGNPEMKERVEKWNKYRNTLIPDFDTKEKVRTIRSKSDSDEKIPSEVLRTSEYNIKYVRKKRYENDHSKIPKTNDQSFKDKILKKDHKRKSSTVRTYSTNRLSKQNIRTKADITIGSGKIS